jgi:peptide/nickel transport system ATP-binding protein
MSLEAPADTAAVTIRELTVAYRRRARLLRVLDHVSLEIRAGEAYGLVGESGCGKTTVALSLMRYLAPNAVIESGAIEFAGHDLLALGDNELQQLRGNRMAMVYQEPGSALNPSIRIGRQIAEVYEQHRGLNAPDALAAAAEMLATVQISDRDRMLRRYPHELSGGQQQRVMLAMALATDPDLLVLDEPTTGLDATVEAEVLDLVEALRDKFHAAILFVSHNLGIVARICERVGVLYAGRLIEQGPAQELFSDPRHPYTEALLRCMPRLGMRKGVDRLDPIPGSLPPLGAQPAGCIYAERCPLARERCREQPPPLIETGTAHLSRCFYPDEVSSIPRPPGLELGAAPAREGSVLFEATELLKTYEHGVVAVAGVDFELARGEVLGLVGESGSGKTSLAKCVVGLVEPTSGTLRLDGEELSRRRNGVQRKALQMVFQNPDGALNPRKSVRRILRRSVRMLGGQRGSANDARVSELRGSVRLEERHLDQRPGSLSGGLKQRAAIARAFAGSPELVLCDEPTSALDVSVQAAILNLLVELQSRAGVAYLFISHDLAIVRYIADRIAVMYLGQLVDVGPAEAVFAPPHHPYTEALVSAIPALAPSPTERIRLHGTLPSASDPPSGCRFHTRCPRKLGAVCEEQEPPWQTGAEGHRYRCHIAPEELRRLQRE